MARDLFKATKCLVHVDWDREEKYDAVVIVTEEYANSGKFLMNKTLNENWSSFNSYSMKAVDKLDTFGPVRLM